MPSRVAAGRRPGCEIAFGLLFLLAGVLRRAWCGWLCLAGGFARVPYRLAGHVQWKRQAKANGLKPKELLRLS